VTRTARRWARFARGVNLVGQLAPGYRAEYREGLLEAR
jgi:hypothetical protein